YKYFLQMALCSGLRCSEVFLGIFNLYVTTLLFLGLMNLLIEEYRIPLRISENSNAIDSEFSIMVIKLVASLISFFDTFGRFE
ncbi:hypothetical protein, partial [Vibrio harveyi]|uniref:hypothetical protein n=1 Tax=Vibrio harveyi TaxID=669 RepID=UPI000AC5E3E7